MADKIFTQEGMRAVLASTVEGDNWTEAFGPIHPELLDVLAAAAFKLAEEHAETEYERGYEDGRDAGYDAGLDACAWTHE